MISYYCIVSLPGVQVGDVVVLKGADDDAARAEMTRVSTQWPGYETIALYAGERCVAVLSNPILGFPIDPLLIPAEAA